MIDQADGHRQADARPLRNSAAIGELDLDAETTTTIGAAGTWYIIEGAGTLGNETARFTNPADSTFRYNGRFNRNCQIVFSGALKGKNGDTYEVGIFKNGSLEPASVAQYEGQGTNAPVSVHTTAIEDISPDDDVSVRLRNIDAANDGTITTYNFQVASI